MNYTTQDLVKQRVFRKMPDDARVITSTTYHEGGQGVEILTLKRESDPDWHMTIEIRWTVPASIELNVAPDPAES